MDYEQMKNKAIVAISRFPKGEVFIVNDLFTNSDWQSYAPKDRKLFGRMFSNDVDEKSIKGVERYQREHKGQNKYIKI